MNTFNIIIGNKLYIQRKGLYNMALIGLVLVMCMPNTFAQIPPFRIIYEPSESTLGSQIKISKGKGQEHNREFFDIGSIYFVQFGAYSKSNVDKIKAPNISEQVWLIYHAGTIIENNTNDPGCYYVVKPCQSEQEAKAYVDYYKRMGIDCFYNVKLLNVAFSLQKYTDSILNIKKAQLERCQFCSNTVR